MNAFGDMRTVAYVFAGMVFAAAAWGQPRPAGCPSSLRVTAGSSTVIDCAVQMAIILTKTITHSYRKQSPVLIQNNHFGGLRPADKLHVFMFFCWT